MSDRFENKEKSLKRRFLLILGVITFICFCGLGLMIIFWDRIPLTLPQTQRNIFGAFIIIYAILRFVRLFKKRDDEFQN
jgi:uncharacterized membrane protein HdeD (DUF308 family)